MQSGGPPVVEQVSPIYRLDASSWARVGYYLGANDATRLYNAGNVQLATLVGSHVRDLKLEWSSLRFIDMHLVMERMTSFKLLTSFEFHQEGCTRRSWTPVWWSLLPCTLASLSLCFLGAPTEFLVETNLISEVLPSLLHLELEDVLPFYQIEEPGETDRIDLSRLPSTLISLRIASQRQAEITTPLTDLPPYLEDLELNFPMTFDETFHCDLPRLPVSLKRLFLRDHHRFRWNIHALDLPPSLETLELTTPQKAHTAGLGVKWKPNVSRGTMIDMTGAATRLTNLKRLLAPSLLMTAHQALDLLPPSVTLLDVILVSKGRDRFEEAMEKLAPKLVAFYRETWSEMEESIFEEKWSSCFTNLKTVTAIGRSSLEFTPATVKSLTLGYHNGTGMPPVGLETFSVATMDNCLSWSHEHRLKHLTWGYVAHLKSDWAEALPDTLESLAVSMVKLDDWRSLMHLMSTTSRLPHLSRIQVVGHSDASYLDYLDCITSRQLKKIAIQSNTALRPLCPTLLSSLPQSHLEELWMDLDEDDDDTIVSLLNHLPQKLKSLYLHSNCSPSPTWPVTLPNTLTSLALSSDSFRFHETETDRPEIEMNFCLPPSLTQLSIMPESVEFFAYVLPSLSLSECEIDLAPANTPPGQELSSYVFKHMQGQLPQQMICDEERTIEYLEDDDNDDEV